jgi:hypothetical protein
VLSWISGRGDRAWFPIVAAATVGLAFGLVVGALVTDRSGILERVRPQKRDTVATSISVGAINQAHDSVTTGWDFELPVLNSTQEAIDADLVAIEGVPTSLTSAKAEQIAPGAWGLIRFSAPANCDAPTSSSVSSVTLRVSAPGSRSSPTIPLPGVGSVLLDYDRAFCASPTPISAGELAGVWILEQAYGPDADLVGVHLMRFTRGGAYVADPEGRLLSDDSAIRGRYRLRGELLETSVEGGTGCSAGPGTTWRVTLDASDRLSMVWIRGDCPEGEQGTMWVSRRVLSDQHLPPVG